MNMKKLWLIPLALVLVMAVIPVASVNALTVDIAPDSLNTLSNRKYITCYLEYPEGDINTIDIPTLKLHVEKFLIPVDTEAPATIGDYDNDGIPDLMVKFFVKDILCEYFKAEGDYMLHILGNLVNGESIRGWDIIWMFKSGQPV